MTGDEIRDIDIRSKRADIIDNWVKSLIAFLTIAACVYLYCFARFGKLADPDYKDSPMYKICCFLAGSKTTDIYNQKAENRQQALEKETQVVEDYHSKVSDSDVLVLTDIPQNEKQMSISKDLDYHQKTVSALKNEPYIVSGWIYAGARYADGTWKERSFDFGDTLVENRQYVSAQALNIRKTEPRYTNGQWQKGSVVGGLFENDMFLISAIREIPGKGGKALYWVDIHVLER